MQTKKAKRLKLLPFSMPDIGAEEIREVADSMMSGWLTTGPKTQKFIEKFRKYVGAKYGSAFNSATAGLHSAYLSAGLEKGDEVITSPLTFCATANTIIHAGGKVIFADIDTETLNINVDKIKEKISQRTKIIVPVHFGGLPCDMNAISTLAEKNNCIVIEDAAHAVGAQYGGNKIGSISDMTVFSFHPNKNITTGEGGMVTFNDSKYAEKLKMLSFHGINKKVHGNPFDYDVELPGFKYNMLDIQAAIGLHQLDKINSFNKRRTEIAEKYYEAFVDTDEISLPEQPKYNHKRVWHIFTPLIKTEKLKINRNEFMALMKEENIGTGYHYRAVHLHPFYEKLGFKKGQFPNAEYVSERIITLPLFPKMTDTDTEDVIYAVKKIISENINK